MISPMLFRYAGALLLMAVLCGCAPGKPPFLIVQMCLGNEQGLAEFKRALQSIAQAEHMHFIEGSAKARSDLEKMGALHQADPIIHVGVEGENGVGLTAGNIGLPGYQVAIGFSEGSDRPTAQTLASKVVSKLVAHWSVRTISDGKGALPLEGCKRPKSP